MQALRILARHRSVCFEPFSHSFQPIPSSSMSRHHTTLQRIDQSYPFPFNSNTTATIKTSNRRQCLLSLVAVCSTPSVSFSTLHCFSYQGCVSNKYKESEIFSVFSSFSHIHQQAQTEQDSLPIFIHIILHSHKQNPPNTLAPRHTHQHLHTQASPHAQAPPHTHQHPLTQHPYASALRHRTNLSTHKSSITIYTKALEVQHNAFIQ